MISDDEINEIESIPLDYVKSKKFLHCKNCIEQFMFSPLHKVMTPKEYGIYEGSTYDFMYPDGSTREIFVIWCKRCGRSVWDSRNLEEIY